MSIALPRFQYLYSQVLEDRGERIPTWAVRWPNSKLAQKFNITLQERSWRLVGVKVVDNPLTVLWKYMPVRNTHDEL
jgi:hypothetical protein